MRLKIKDNNIIPFPFVRIFLLLYISFNCIGLINFPFYKNTLNDSSNFILFIVGLLGFTLGFLTFRKLKILKSSLSISKNRTKNIKIFLVMSVFLASFFIVLTNALAGGIIILSGTKRFTSFAITNLCVYSSIVMTIVYFSNRLLQDKKITFMNVIFIVFLSLLIISLGYRSPVISLLGGLYIVFYSIRNSHQNSLKKIFSTKIIISALLFLIIMSYIASFRVSLKWDVNSFYKNINYEYVEKKAFLKPIVPIVSLFRYDQEVVNKLIKKSEGNYMYLKFAFSNIQTLLPGEQLGARNIVGKMIGSRDSPTGKPWSITPTLQGAFFVDGGFFFTFIGFFFTAAFIEVLRKVIKKNRDPFYFTLYGLMVVGILKSIHTGYFDVSMYILIVILFSLRFLTFNIKYTFKMK